MMEFTRITSHLVALATGGMEVGALTAMTFGFREREIGLDMNEMITGLRMNPAYVRPGGVAEDLPENAKDDILAAVKLLRHRFKDLGGLLIGNSIWVNRLKDVGYLDLTGCMQLGLTGPVLRSTGLPHDLRKAEPYCGYENYDFDVPTQTTCDSYGRFLIRVDEMYESLRIIEQAVDKLEPGPVMVADAKIAWPSKLSIGPDGQGNSLAHIKEIMGDSMEALIHHFKLVTEGFKVPAGQVYQAMEGPRGELGVVMVSDGGTRPYRVHFRDPAFNNLQAIPVMCEGGMVSDVVVAVASLDPVLGGVDR
jgi:NADH-quinone oxidoreductase subunit D